MKKNKIYIAGHNGMVGSAIVRILKEKDKDVHLITRTRTELELTNQKAVQDFFRTEKPDQVYLAAGKIGGIYANTKYPAQFIYENLVIQSNIIHGAFINKINNLLFISSSCVYPKVSKQPISEESLLFGPLEKSVEPYAVAKIAGMKLCENYSNQYSLDYKSIVPNNLYGPGDTYDQENSHVVAALIKKFHDAKVKNKPNVTLWGSGRPLREFLYIDDFVRSCILLMNKEKKILKKNLSKFNYYNVGSGSEISILGLAQKIKKVVNYKGLIQFDLKKPDGIKRKFLNTSRIQRLGWKPKISLLEGLKKTYKDFKNLNT